MPINDIARDGNDVGIALRYLLGAIICKLFYCGSNLRTSKGEFKLENDTAIMRIKEQSSVVFTQFEGFSTRCKIQCLAKTNDLWQNGLESKSQLTFIFELIRTDALNKDPSVVFEGHTPSIWTGVLILLNHEKKRCWDSIL